MEKIVPEKGAVILINYEKEKLPIAFTVALAHNDEALKYFVGLPQDSRNRIVEQTWAMNSTAEMTAFVDLLAAQSKGEN